MGQYRSADKGIKQYHNDTHTTGYYSLAPVPVAVDGD